MKKKRRSVAHINVVARRFDETLAFYRLLGFDIPEPVKQPPGALHAEAKVEDGAGLEIDNDHLARIYNASWRAPSGARSALITISVATRAEVDETYAALTAAGHEGRQPPYDAFWGSRFAVVADPEGNDVGLMSPREERFRSWPPSESPPAARR